MHCPCNSPKNLKECCQPIINGIVKAQTAEQLMRARYTAYSNVNMEFINQTHDPNTRHETNFEDNKNWAKQTVWLNLEIISTTKGLAKDSSGIVEFKAKYSSKNQTNSSDEISTHHEISEFNKIDNIWYFTRAL